MKAQVIFLLIFIMSLGAFAQDRDDAWAGNGTGIVIDSRGIIATNYHVIEKATEIEVDFGQGENKRSFRCEVLVSDKKNDLAILKITDRRFNGFGPLPYTFKTSSARRGDGVFALGYPMALSGLGREIKYTKGDVSALSGVDGDITTYTLSLPIQPGNSGGPLFDFNGNLLGITNAKIVRAEVDNVSYAIKNLYLQNLADLSSYTINLPAGAELKGKSIQEQIEILTRFVGLIKVSGQTSTPVTSRNSPEKSPISLEGNWRTRWSAPGQSVFSGEMYLTISGENVEGSIKWKLEETTSPYLRAKIGLIGTEYIRGRYDQASRMLNLEGYSKNDPYTIIGTDVYRITVSVDGKSLEGQTWNHGDWGGRFTAMRK